MRKRYPATFRTLVLMAGLGVVLGLSYLWPPAAWIVVGGIWLWLLVVAIREDRKKRRSAKPKPKAGPKGPAPSP